MSPCHFQTRVPPLQDFPIPVFCNSPGQDVGSFHDGSVLRDGPLPSVLSVMIRALL
jgi:hypothetical protein